jgi:hypothetical protein
MRKQFLLAAIFAVFLGSVLLFVACGGGGDDDDDSTSDDDDDVQQGEPGTIQAFVHDFQTKQAVAGALVEALNDETGEPLDPPVTATSPADGSVTLTVPAEITKIGIKVSKEGATDTIQYHFELGVTGEEFLLISNATKELVSLGLGVTIDPALSVTAGGIYWGNPASESSVGCAEVSFDPDDGAAIHYFGPDALPTLARDPTGTTPADGQGTNPAYDSKGHSISYYVSLNKTPASDITLIGTIYDVAGSGTADAAKVSTEVIPKLVANSAVITNVYFSDSDYPTDPSPAWCTQ